MHDLDQPLTHQEFGYGEQEDNVFNTQEFEFEYDGEAGAVLDSAEEMEMASDLLGATNEAELEQFLGKLFKSVTKKIGRGLKGGVGKMLGGALKKVAKAALPTVGSALGTFVAPGLGTAAGGALGAAAGQALGLELEGLSPEDQEFEAARRVVRLGAQAVANAAGQPDNGSNPAQTAKHALANAAQKHAPGLLSRAPNGAAGGARQGRWVRRGSSIVILGA